MCAGVDGIRVRFTFLMTCQVGQRENRLRREMTHKNFVLQTQKIKFLLKLTVIK